MTMSSSIARRPTIRRHFDKAGGFDQDDLDKAKKALKTNKAVGEDGRAAEFIKCLDSPEYDRTTLDLWNRCRTNSEGVRELKNTLLHPLHKKGDTRECTNYRGIASLNAEAKLFEQALLRILNDFISEIQYIDDTQFGLLEGD
jgi:hypothetical protein